MQMYHSLVTLLIINNHAASFYSAKTKNEVFYLSLNFKQDIYGGLRYFLPDRAADTSFFFFQKWDCYFHFFFLGGGGYKLFILP